MAQPARQQRGVNPWGSQLPELEGSVGSGTDAPKVAPETNNNKPRTKAAELYQAWQERTGVNPTPGTNPKAETALPNPSGEFSVAPGVAGTLFDGPDTARFTQPTLAKQAESFGVAPQEQAASTTNSNPFAEALQRARGQKPGEQLSQPPASDLESQQNTPQQELESNNLENAAPEVTPTKSQKQILAEMEAAAKERDEKTKTQLTKELQEAIAAANRATKSLERTHADLRTAAVRAKETPLSIAGTGVIEHIWALVKTAQQLTRKDQSLARLAQEAQARKNQKKRAPGVEAGVPKGGPQETKAVQDMMHHEKNVANGA